MNGCQQTSNDDNPYKQIPAIPHQHPAIAQKTIKYPVEAVLPSKIDPGCIFPEVGRTFRQLNGLTVKETHLRVLPAIDYSIEE